MKPLRVALIHRDSPRSMDNRMVGIWSYPVPEFEWDHYPQQKGFQLNRTLFEGEYDLIFYEDGKLYGSFYGGDSVPIVYYVVDSTLSEGHYEQRKQQSEQTDLILVDHDRLKRFKGGPPVRRLSHCVNDRLFHDYGLHADVDVSYHCRTSGSREREQMGQWLETFCAEHELEYAGGVRIDEGYAQAFNRSKISVNLTRTPTNRPHRMFDALACHTCVLTSILPEVEPVELVSGVHYATYIDRATLAAAILGLLAAGTWERFAENGYQHVMTYHTWEARARELRLILREELGI